MPIEILSRVRYNQNIDCPEQLETERSDAMQNFTRIPNTVFEMHLSPIEFCVLCCLLKCRNSVTGKCFPSYSKIASECRIARSSVAKAVKSLQKKHILKVKHNYYNHKQRCNTYEFAHGWYCDDTGLYCQTDTNKTNRS
ncbi:helix-turn-helix domain-containing protein [Methanobrevibacter sp.]